MAYVDFRYLGVRVRESSGLLWNEKNAKSVRDQLDRIMLAIKDGTFRFGETFPHSTKRDYFTTQEMVLYGQKRKPQDVKFKKTALEWYDLRRESQRIAGRTLLGYKSNIDHYLVPFFGDLTFEHLNAALFENFISWARKRKLRNKRGIGNTTINKFFVPLKMICRHAAIAHGWGGTFDPFFGFKKLPQSDAREKIFPFSLSEQQQVREALPAHWRPYFDFAFCAGLRPGEQIALKGYDINWQKRDPPRTQSDYPRRRREEN